MIVVDVGATQIRAVWCEPSSAEGGGGWFPHDYDVATDVSDAAFDPEALHRAAQALVGQILSQSRVRTAPVLMGVTPGPAASRRLSAEVATSNRVVRPADVMALHRALVDQRPNLPEFEGIHCLRVSHRVDGVPIGAVEPVGRRGARLAGTDLWVSESSAKVKALRDACAEVQAGPVQIVANPVACGFGLLTEAEKKAGAVLVDLGARATTLSVWSSGWPQGIAQIAGGGDRLTGALAARLGVTRDEADRIKLRHGRCALRPSDDYAFELADGKRLTRGTLASWIEEELGGAFDRMRELVRTPAGGPPTWVFVGGGAMMQGLSEFAHARLGAEARIGHMTSPRMPLQFAQPSWAALAALTMLAREPSQRDLLRMPNVGPVPTRVQKFKAFVARVVR